MDVKGQTVLITGASRGIGAACARELASRGARLALTARSSEGLESVGGDEALKIPEDLLSSGAPGRIVARTLERFGAIDILVNNAGIGLYRPSWTAEDADVRRMFELNLFAGLELIRLVVPGMRRRRHGCIVNVSSIAGRIPLPWFTLYSASKHALCALSDGLRMELRRDGIQVMTVCPGYVDTGFQDHVLGGRPPERIRRARTFAVSPERCARDILRGIERNSRSVVTPGYGRLLTGLWYFAPGILERRLSGMMKEMQDDERVAEPE